MTAVDVRAWTVPELEHAVLALHVPAVNDRWCAACSRPVPCPTVRALGVAS